MGRVELVIIDFNLFATFQASLRCLIRVIETTTLCAPQGTARLDRENLHIIKGYDYIFKDEDRKLQLHIHLIIIFYLLLKCLRRHLKRW